MRKLSTYPILLAVMLLCIAAKVGYASAYYYDHRGRTVQSVEANRLGGYDRTTTEYDYVDNPISHFAYCANNPLILTDPTGKLLVFAEGRTEEFKAQFQEAYQHLKDHGASEILDQIIEDPNFTVTIEEEQSTKSRYESENTTLYWNPSVGLISEHNLYSVTPAEILNHEGAHALRDYIDSDGQGNDYKVLDNTYGNMEEKRVIENIETPTAYKLGRLKDGEKSRINHFGTPYKVSKVYHPFEKSIIEYSNQ